MTPAKLLSYLDKMELSFRSAEALARQAVLTTLPPLLVGGDGSAGNTQYGAGDGPFILALSGAITQMIAAASPDVLNAGIYQPFFGPLDTYFAANTVTLTVAGKAVTTLDLYASYQNAATIDSFLVGPNTARLYWLSRKSTATALLTPGNVFAPLTTFGAATVGAGAALVYGPGPAPNSIPVVNGGNSQGYTASKGLVAVISTAISGTLTVTVTGTGRTAAGALVTGRTWTGVLDNAAAGAQIAFTPAVAGDRIASITSVSGAGAAGSGGFSLQSVIERVVS